MLIAGVDEVGRGPLAGPVISAAVILPPKHKIKGLNDSKLLTELQRENLFEQICKAALAYAVGRAEVEEIDSLNILQASLLSMKRAVDALIIQPALALIDGIHAPAVSIPTRCIIDGDRLEPAISAASIIAKVTRDREMKQLDLQYPGFGFAQHKGYGTEVHLKALRSLGACTIHRQSFAPVKLVLEYGLNYNTKAGELYRENLIQNAKTNSSIKSTKSSVNKTSKKVLKEVSEAAE